MNKGLIFTLILFFSIAISAQEFKFEMETINYGKIAKGSNGERTFVFTNIGDGPIIIQKVQTSCDCAVPKKPEKPIMPGEKAEIKVSYDTKKLGGFSKQITIFSNAKKTRKIIKIKGYVTKEISLEKKNSILSDN
ncbi:MAG: DUF1573 domain-containing protein [Polaribacter sp.]|uniref:DUF1573 domain-containing protein n=1 Tax=Polaribacter sp. TaxID=1920175 RepID=UPI002F35FACB